MYFYLYVIKYIKMIATNFSELKADLKSILDSVEENNETVVIKRNSGKGAAIISMYEYNSMMETMLLLSSKKNGDRIFESIEQLKSKKVVKKKLILCYEKCIYRKQLGRIFLLVY